MRDPNACFRSQRRLWMYTSAIESRVRFGLRAVWTAKRGNAYCYDYLEKVRPLVNKGLRSFFLQKTAYVTGDMIGDVDCLLHWPDSNWNTNQPR